MTTEANTAPEQITARVCRCNALVAGPNACPHCGAGWAEAKAPLTIYRCVDPPTAPASPEITMNEAAEAVYRKYGTNLAAFWRDAFAAEAQKRGDPVEQYGVDGNCIHYIPVCHRCQLATIEAHLREKDAIRSAPTALDERDKALVEAVAEPWICVEDKPCEEATPIHWEELLAALNGMLATVRAEEREATFVLDEKEARVLADHHYYEAEKAITRRGDRCGQRYHLERLAAIRAIESARTGKVEG